MAMSAFFASITNKLSSKSNTTIQIKMVCEKFLSTLSGTSNGTLALVFIQRLRELEEVNVSYMKEALLNNNTFRHDTSIIISNLQQINTC